MTNRSFSRRVGKRFSHNNKTFILDSLPKYLFTHTLLDDAIKKQKKIVFEIGCGQGENVINNAVQNPECFFFVSEPYKNALVTLLKQILKHNLCNVFIWPDDFNMILNQIPDNTLHVVNIFFPDPWPKKRHKKRRLIHTTDIQSLTSKLRLAGMLYFYSDVKDYIDDASYVFQKYLCNVTQDIFKPCSTYIQTKYHNKALSNNRTCYHLVFQRDTIGSLSI